MRLFGSLGRPATHILTAENFQYPRQQKAERMNYAEQDNPGLNPNFRRLWGDITTTGPHPQPLRAWHAGDVAAPVMTAARRRAEREWSKVSGVAR